MSSSRAEILNHLKSLNGFYVPESIGSEELRQLWLCVLEGFRQCFGLDKAIDPEVMKNVHLYPELQKRFASLSVFDRTLESDLAFQVLEMEWLNSLANHLGFFPIDSYGFDCPSFTWRLMRPGQSSDLRGLHRDVWFRCAMNGPKTIDTEVPPQLQTIKVWMALNVEPGASGLLVSPGSQLNDNPGFSVVQLDGLTKPIVNTSELDEAKFIHAPTPNGSMVLFGEQLMHGGAPTYTDTARISLEFTLARTSQNYFRTFIDSNNVKTEIDFNLSRN